MLSLNELAVFLTAAETGNFSEAGRQMHLSQPAVSQTIDSLEKRFGTKLFVRQGRRVHLTEAGQVLKPLARELLYSARRLDETMSSIHGEVVGEMTVGCSTAAGKYLLPRMIARFRRQYPRVKINVLVSSREWVVSNLLQGVISLGVSSKRIEHRDLEVTDLFMDEVILIAPAGHRWARNARIFPDDLLDESMILREDGAGTREALLEELQRHDITPELLNVGMVLGNTEAIVMSVEEGIGVAFVSRLAAERSLEAGRVVQVNVTGMELCRKVFLMRSRRFPATRAQSEFWDYVKRVEVKPEPA